MHTDLPPLQARRPSRRHTCQVTHLPRWHRHLLSAPSSQLASLPAVHLLERTPRPPPAAALGTHRSRRQPSRAAPRPGARRPLRPAVPGLPGPAAAASRHVGPPPGAAEGGSAVVPEPPGRPPRAAPRRPRLCAPEPCAPRSPARLGALRAVEGARRVQLTLAVTAALESSPPPPRKARAWPGSLAALFSNASTRPHPATRGQVEARGSTCWSQEGIPAEPQPTGIRQPRWKCSVGKGSPSPGSGFLDPWDCMQLPEARARTA